MFAGGKEKLTDGSVTASEILTIYWDKVLLSKYTELSESCGQSPVPSQWFDKRLNSATQLLYRGLLYPFLEKPQDMELTKKSFVNGIKDCVLNQRQQDNLWNCLPKESQLDGVLRAMVWVDYLCAVFENRGMALNNTKKIKLIKRVAPVISEEPWCFLPNDEEAKAKAVDLMQCGASPPQVDQLRELLNVQTDHLQRMIETAWIPWSSHDSEEWERFERVVEEWVLRYSEGTLSRGTKGAEHLELYLFLCHKTPPELEIWLQQGIGKWASKDEYGLVVSNLPNSLRDAPRVFRDAGTLAPPPSRNMYFSPQLNETLHERLSHLSHDTRVSTYMTEDVLNRLPESEAKRTSSWLGISGIESLFALGVSMFVSQGLPASISECVMLRGNKKGVQTDSGEREKRTLLSDIAARFANSPVIYNAYRSGIEKRTTATTDNDESDCVDEGTGHTVLDTDSRGVRTLLENHLPKLFCR